MEAHRHQPRALVRRHAHGINFPYPSCLREPLPPHLGRLTHGNAIGLVGRHLALYVNLVQVKYFPQTVVPGRDTMPGTTFSQVTTPSIGAVTV